MNHVSKVKTSLFGTVIWKADGTVWACGRTPFFQEDRLTPMQISNDIFGDLGKWETVDIQFFDSTEVYLLNHEGQLWEWTKDGDAKLYLDDVVSFSCRGGCYAAIKSDDTLWTWGLNEYGSLGNGTLEDDFTPKQVMSDVKAAAVGSGFLCVLKKDGTLWCCGRNDYGQLGNGATIGSPSFTMVMDHVKAVSAGFFHVVALKEDNTLWQWGGSIPLGGTADNKDAWVPVAEPVQIMENIVVATAGANHTVAIKSDGSVWSWGYNKYGALGYHDENADDGADFLAATPQQIPGLKVAVPGQ